MTEAAHPYDLILPDAAEIETARTAVSQMAGDGRFELVDRASGEKIVLPETAMALIRRVLMDFAEGRAVTLIPIDAEISPRQAADVLNVSRPYVVKLMDEGELDHRRVGSHRRLLLEDVLAYRERMRVKRDTAMDELARLSQEMGGYD